MNSAITQLRGSIQLRLPVLRGGSSITVTKQGISGHGDCTQGDQ